MKFKIDERIIEQFPDLNLGVIIAKGIDNSEKNDEIISFLRIQEEEIKKKFDKGTLSSNPKIEVWRKAYSSFGAKPKKYKCSVENLYRMILDGIELRSINKVVDIYNYISIKHILPVGGDNIDKIEGDITLKFAIGDENFTELNSDETKNPSSGEVVYVDDKDVLCRRWNWRECDKSKMTPKTKNIALVIEGLSSTSIAELKLVVKELSELIQKYCGGKITSNILNSENKEIEF